jgi:hypothetical protein
MAALASSQGRIGCNQTLAPANPTAPRRPNGRQQAKVESAAITAAKTERMADGEEQQKNRSDSIEYWHFQGPSPEVASVAACHPASTF